MQHQVEAISGERFERMKKLVGFVFLSILAVGFSLAYSLGAFREVSIDLGESGPHRLVYKPHLGPYHKIVPVIEDVEAWARENSEPCRLSFGEFIDDVEKVPEDRLRSHAGCVVEKNWSGSLPADSGLEYREVPARLYVRAEFDGAASIGPLKVYPKAMEFIAENNRELEGPVIELYEILEEGKRMKTTYLFPVSAQSESNLSSRQSGPPRRPPGQRDSDAAEPHPMLPAGPRRTRAP